jgi:dTDP-4-amino-4,6-dideoxygalactose transaminase
MRIGRSLPPAAAPLGWKDVWHGVTGACRARRSLRAREEEIRREFGVAHVFLVSSGSAGLRLALTALKSLSAGTEAVMPAYTCFSVPAAILKAGLRPVLCDIGPSTFDFDHDLLEGTLTSSTLCVIAHHLFGIPSDIERTRATCRARGIFVVEDAAQAMGAEQHGRKLGTLGDVGIFSFGRGKHVTCGSGGAIVTNSSRIAEAIALRYRDVPPPSRWETLKDFVTLVLMAILIRPRLYWIPTALPFLRLGETVFPTDVPVRRLSGMKAGVLHNWQIRLARSNRIRSETADYFRQHMPPSVADVGPHPYLRLPILAASPKDKQRLYSFSKAHGLGMSLAYPTPVNEIPEVRATVNGRQFPSARKIAATLVTVPTHQWLLEKDKRALADVCRDSRSA